MIKNFLFLILLLFIISCIKNNSPLETLKYSKDDLVPLNDSTKNLYYKDAALIEFRQVILDTSKRYNQVSLSQDNIHSFYEDLINIYNSSYLVSDSFFENVSRIHSFASNMLYYLIVSVDTSKSWVVEWKTGNKITGIIGIDSLINNYNIDISYNYESHGGHVFTLIFDTPLNYFALQYKLLRTNEFIYVEPDGIIGGGSSISLIDINDKIYKYSIGWGDCPSGCIYYHFWEVIIKNEKVELFKEYGDPFFKTV